MKLSPQDERIMQRMAPGVLCRDGFLGDDRRSLGEILEADRSAVEGLGLTHEKIADRLEAILHQAMTCYGTPTDVGNGLTGVYIEAMGRIPCPFGGGKVFPKGEVELSDPSGTKYCFTPLSVHLIREHGFYQGHGSRYRLDPAAITRVLGLM